MNPRQLPHARRLRAQGITLDALAARYGVSRTALYRALNGEKRERDPTPIRTAKELWFAARTPEQRRVVLANFGDLLTEAGVL